MNIGLREYEYWSAKKYAVQDDVSRRPLRSSRKQHCGMAMQLGLCDSLASDIAKLFAECA
jgi:hypothetical protein